MVYPIGVDFGTTNSTMSVWQDDRAQIIIPDNHPTLPSSLYVTRDGRMIVGHAAKKRAMQNPGRYLTSAKRYLGEDEVYWKITDRIYTPIEVAASTLAQLKQSAEAFLGGEIIQEVVITIPSCFSPDQKRGLKLAGELGGLKILQIIPESIAAAISYGFQQRQEQCLLIYDWGGGRFDVTIVEVHQHQFHIVATVGDAHLGGEDLDFPLIQYLIERLSNQTASNLERLQQLCQEGIMGIQTDKSAVSLDLLIAWQRLKEAAVEAKTELNSSPKALIYLPDILGYSLSEEVLLATYNRLIQPLVDRTITKIETVLQRAHLNADDIDQVLLIGGSTHNLLVKEQITTMFQKSSIVEQAEAGISLGAAIVAADIVSRQYDIPGDYLKNMNLIL